MWGGGGAPPPPATLCLQAVTSDSLQQAIPGIAIEEARKIVSAVHRCNCLPKSVRAVRRTSLETVRAQGIIPAVEIRAIWKSKTDPFVKYGFEMPDGVIVETVLIPLEREGRFSVCVSSQAGCGLACTFCATGGIGLRRNLETWEIVEQVRMVSHGLDKVRRQRVHGIVFQGMGEPLANLENVVQAIRVLCDPSALAIDGRTITVCTVGVPGGIRRLARETPKVRLALSIGSARSEVRQSLMPIDRVHPLEAVLEAAADHARFTGLAPMWAVTLLAGVNDSSRDAHALAGAALSFTKKAGMKPQISIIPYNSVDPSGMEPYGRSDDETEAAFRKILREEGFASRKRYSGGADVRAACGQLAAQNTAEPQRLQR
jgi:23S rRNA (adenine2503-C2)-methyltransferase